MQWSSLGFKENPFNTDPIQSNTLSLYTGNTKKRERCLELFEEKKVLLVVEGSRGVGTTSFANVIRFSAQHKKSYLTPTNEIRVEANWGLETLLAAVIASIVREIEVFHEATYSKDKRFQNAKAISSRIAEAYRSFGVEALGFGANYGKAAGIVTQPVVVPSTTLGHHLEDLSQIIIEHGYKHGILIQLNNLDVGAIHEETHLRYLFNAFRDYVQTPGFSWILVGDVGLRKFIAQEVDRLDDIVSSEVIIESLTPNEYSDMVQKRLDYYRSSNKAVSPIEEEVFQYLYNVTKGRLRYIFGLLKRLVSYLHVEDLTGRLNLTIVKPMVIELAKERISRYNLSELEEAVLKILVKLGSGYSDEVAKRIHRSVNQTNNVLLKLSKLGLVRVSTQTRKKHYTPDLDATIAYHEE